MYQKKLKNTLNDSQVISLIEKVSNYFETSPKDVVSKSRKTELVNTRMYICALLKHKHKLTLSKIGEYLSNRDHTTIVYMLGEYKNQCQSKISDVREKIKTNYNELDKLTNQL